MIKRADFTKQIRNNELNISYTPLSEKDSLGNALVALHNNFLEIKNKEDIRKAKAKQTNWINHGIGKFSDLLRLNNDDMQLLADNIITNMVKYVNAHQGGLYLFNEEDKDNIFLELIAAYAYDRKKFLDIKIEIGVGLIGTCAIEKKTIYLTEIPQDYVKISSGFGQTNPNSVLIVPLTMENKVYGIIELTSLNKFENYEIELSKKWANSSRS